MNILWHQYSQQLLNLKDEKSFEALALEVFRYQAKYCPTYRHWLELLNCQSQNIDNLKAIPFMPIEAFKHHKILTGNKAVQQVFTSSGTSGSNTSRHYISDLSLYEISFLNTFEYFYGDIKQYCILALLPSYLERKNSSLVYMVDHLIKQSKQSDSGFFLYDTDRLIDLLKKQTDKQQKTILIGVSYALWDLAERHQTDLSSVIIMETGGMKGQRPEITRQELHFILKSAFRSANIHSEYGMTELLSQAYSKGGGLFQTPAWMQIQVRDIHDPFRLLADGQSGGLNIIDLANLHSCSFIATQDMAKKYPSGQFEIQGRMDASLQRGCNLMLTDI